MKSKHRNKQIISKEKHLVIKERRYSQYICLEHCEIHNKTKGREKAILETLKDFGNADKLKIRNMHSLSRDGKLKKYYDICDKYKADKLFSVDIEGRNSAYRLLFCIYENDKVYKILDLCADITHK